MIIYFDINNKFIQRIKESIQSKRENDVYKSTGNNE